MDVATEISPVDLVMAEMGFTPFDTGPYVTELRGVMAEKVERGLRRASAGTFPGVLSSITAEERARAHLAMNWEIAQGMTYRVDCIDGKPWGWTFNAVTMKRRWRIKWQYILPWLGDRRREAGFLVRRWWRRKVLKQVNPYSLPATS